MANQQQSPNGHRMMDRSISPSIHGGPSMEASNPWPAGWGQRISSVAPVPAEGGHCAKPCRCPAHGSDLIAATMRALSAVSLSNAGLDLAIDQSMEAPSVVSSIVCGCLTRSACQIPVVAKGTWRGRPPQGKSSGERRSVRQQIRGNKPDEPLVCQLPLSFVAGQRPK